ncbi:transcription elongation factor GreA [Psittacicella hinzii]|uniref:Transcription elongation factor GreA n=1 Tax=Psittacicella hinzii TaxID=2028575 RepID=A0A3A1YB49_9GAMM|nr:transcription elongation factor GreA [Psittacicella hinzii]RIY34576.1 transcription elongation factor GreA [Psittacicella hinzii]
METIPITQRGERLLRKELEYLVRERRPAITKAIAEAREHGDLKENSEYHAAREEQSLIEARISYIEGLVSNGQVIDVTKLDVETVVFGCKVKLYNIDTDEEITYRIVGEDEADVKSGRISYKTPIARGLIGKEEGDEVTIVTPSGKLNFEILEVEYSNEPVDAE